MKISMDVLDSTFIKGPVIADLNCSLIGDSLIVAPHPDDESLACGGTIALLRENGYSVHVVFTTDGTMSHPNSKTYPSDKLRLLREEEAKNALAILGVTLDTIRFMRLPDSQLNKLDISNHMLAISTLKKYLLEFKPTTIFLPWRSDPHPDHIASWNFADEAIKNLYDLDGIQFQVLEYPVWFWERTEVSELNKVNSVDLWKVDIENKLALKKRAIAEHASQLGKIIKDDQNGFALSDAMVENFLRNEEVFFEYNDLRKMI